MKANIARIPGETEPDEIAADIAILAQLSTVHGTQTRLGKERELLLATITQRRREVERRAADLETARRRATVAGSPDDGRVENATDRAILDDKQRAIDEATAELELSIRELTPREAGLAAEQRSAEEIARRLSGGLSLEARRIYASLSSVRRLPFSVALTGECCGGCNMRLPSGLLGEIRRTRRLHRCPSCKRVVSASSAQP